MKKKTLIIGASTKAWRFSNKAAHRLVEHGHPIVLLGKDEGEVEGVKILHETPKDSDFDTVTVYVNPSIQAEYYDYIISLKPKRIVFNPGTENPEFERKAEENGIEVVEDCTLVMLRSGTF